MKFNLDDVKAKNLPHLKWHDILQATGLTGDELIELAIYFSHFTCVEDDKRKCPGCDARLVDEPIMQALGIATFTWGICHGEGFCSRCGYPARAYHFNIGPIKKLNIVLPYHPDELVKRI